MHRALTIILVLFLSGCASTKNCDRFHDEFDRIADNDLKSSRINIFEVRGDYYRGCNLRGRLYQEYPKIRDALNHEVLRNVAETPDDGWQIDGSYFFGSTSNKHFIVRNGEKLCRGVIWWPVECSPNEVTPEGLEVISTAGCNVEAYGDYVEVDLDCSEASNDHEF